MRLTAKELLEHLQMDKELREVWQRFDADKATFDEVYDTIIRDIDWMDSLSRREQKMVNRRRWAYDFCVNLYHFFIQLFC